MTTSVAGQTDRELGGAASVLVRQRRDHVELDRLLDRVLATSGPEQDEVLRRLCRLVFSHAFAEEAVLWPAVRAAVPDGEAITLRVEQEHQEVNELVTALEQGRHDDPDRAELLSRTIQLLRQDVRDEEDDLLPRLQEVSTPAQLQRLGVAWELVRRVAPTRAHPVVARRPPGNLLAAVPLSVLDRLRDRLDQVALAGPGPVRPACRRTSSALAAVAGALEHVPPFTRGEDASTRAVR